MPSPSEVAELQRLLVELNTLAAQDLTRAWRSVESLDALAVRDVLLQAAPEVSAPYLAAAAELSAQWYDEQAPASVFRAVPAPPPSVEQVQASVRWAVSPLFGGGAASPLSLLAGSVQRMVFNSSRETILTNVAAENGARWARYASASACPFCRMLTTRGSVYKTAAKAGDGHRYHDNCRCMAVAVRPGESYDPPSYVEKWSAEYKAAAEATNGSTNAVLNHMRANAL